MNVLVRTNDRFVTVDGRKARYLEEGSGVPAILLHGSSLGSSADVFRRNLRALGAQGIRAIAVDLPGFGKSDPAEDLSGAARNAFVLRFMDALGLNRAALIGHSSSGGPAVSIALKNPDRVSHVIVLGTGSLLPPLEAQGTKVGGREGAARGAHGQAGADRRGYPRAARGKAHQPRSDHRGGAGAAPPEQHRALLRAVRPPPRRRFRGRRQGIGAVVA